MTTDKLAEAIRNPGGGSIVNAPNAAKRVREAFVVIDRDRVQRQVDTVMQYDDQSPYPDEDRWYPTIKSGAAHIQIRAGADHARDMAVHYLALAQWIDEHPPAPPVDEKAVEALANDLAVALDRDHARDLARRLVAGGWKRGGVS